MDGSEDNATKMLCDSPILEATAAIVSELSTGSAFFSSSAGASVFAASSEIASLGMIGVGLSAPGSFAGVGESTGCVFVLSWSGIFTFLIIILP